MEFPKQGNEVTENCSPQYQQNEENNFKCFFFSEARGFGMINKQNHFSIVVGIAQGHSCTQVTEDTYALAVS